MRAFGTRQGRHGFSIVALIVALAAGDGAAAQEATEEPITLDTVTVEGTSTAADPVGPGVGYGAENSRAGTKTDTPILETPQAIQVLTRQLIEDTNPRSMTDILRHAAGVMPGGYYYGWDYFRIRGFDADTALYIDGLANGYYVGTSLDPFLFDRIEVVRGPASTLYGSGSLGGMVNAVSKRPLVDDFANVEFIYGTEGDYTGRLDGGAILTPDETLYGRLLLSYSSDDTFIDHVDPSEHLIIAPSLTWKPNTATTFTLLTQYAKDDNEGAPTLPARGTVLPNVHGSIPLDRFLGEPDTPEEVNIETTRVGYEFRHEFNDAIAVRQNARVTWHDETWKNIIYPTCFDAGSGPFLCAAPDDRTLVRYFYSRESEAVVATVDTAIEARFDTGAFRHLVAFGIDYRYFDEDAISSDFTAFDKIDIFDPVYGGPVPAQPLTVPAATTARQTGFYLQDQISFDKLTLTVGGRFDHASVSDLTQKSTDEKFSPKVGVTYEFAPGFAAYANFSESFNPQPGNRTQSGANVPPETGQNYEVGIKADSPDGSFGGTLAVFHLTRQNVANSVAGGLFYEVSGEQRSRGFEADVHWAPLPGLDLQAAYTYTDAEVTKDADAAKVGDEVRNVPDHIFSGWAHYRLQEGFFEGLGFGAGVSYYTEQQGDLPNTFKLPAYTLVDAAISYEVGPYKAQLNVTNLLDEEYYVGSYSDFYVLPGAPTEARLTLGYTF